MYALTSSSSRERSEAQLRIEIATRQRRVERVDLLEGAAFMLKRGPRYGRIVMMQYLLRVLTLGWFSAITLDLDLSLCLLLYV